ncbi:MAG: carboxymuconolactone decarboxylase family protein [Alphaproteobacteria bacterium]|nr:carboxymuconolactone decarboxylase family protein [Alphaproteobacteria bacterium]
MNSTSRITELNRQRKVANARLARLNSMVYKAFLEMEKVTYCDGALSKKHKELIAAAIGVVTNCESCMQWHIEQAVMEGATEQEVLEAIEVAIEMGIGPATVNARFALEAMDQSFKK